MRSDENQEAPILEKPSTTGVNGKIIILVKRLLEEKKKIGRDRKRSIKHWINITFMPTFLFSLAIV